MEKTNDVDLLNASGNMMLCQNFAAQKIDDVVTHVFRHNHLDTDMLILIDAVVGNVSSSGPRARHFRVACRSAFDNFIYHFY